MIVMRGMNRNSNIFDKLIIFYLILQVFGGYGGPFQPIRIYIILCIPWIISFSLRHKSTLTYYKYEITTFFIWFFYAVLSLLWVIMPSEGIKEVIYLLISFIGFMLLIFLSKNAINPKESILKGWKLLFIFTIPIAIVEIIFDLHLSIAYQSEEMMMNFGHGVVMRRQFASVTFGNLNGYNTILTYIIPFLFGGIIGSDIPKKKNKLINVILIILLCALIIINSSRASFICLLIVLFFYILFRISNIQTLIISFIIFLSILLFFAFSKNEFLNFIFLRFETQGFSDEGRWLVLRSGLNELINSNFMGIGASDFMPTMEKIYSIDNSSAHNFFLEVLVQYGIIIFILFIGILVRMIKQIKKNKLRRDKFIIISALLIYPIATIINSGYILDTTTWIYISSLLIISDNSFNIKDHY